MSFGEVLRRYKIRSYYVRLGYAKSWNMLQNVTTNLLQCMSYNLFITHTSVWNPKTEGTWLRRLSNYPQASHSTPIYHSPEQKCNASLCKGYGDRNPVGQFCVCSSSHHSKSLLVKTKSSLIKGNFRVHIIHTQHNKECASWNCRRKPLINGGLLLIISSPLWLQNCATRFQPMNLNFANV